MNRGGVSVECANPQVGGFPFRIGVSCDHLGYEDGSRQLQASASGFRSLAQVYQPTRALAELDGPLHLSAPGLGSIRLDWDRLRASVRIATPLPERVSVEAEGLKGTSEASGSAGSPLFAAARTDGHLRPNGADIDWAGSFVGLTVDPGVVDGRIVQGDDFRKRLVKPLHVHQEGQVAGKGRVGLFQRVAVQIADGGVQAIGLREGPPWQLEDR
ncbi:MAG: DUF2125 domain-containing protein [Chlorobi bacterium CHB2]|nr:DUF2125 domain-containing protein [Chlorobi bacterium CHB2]